MLAPSSSSATWLANLVRLLRGSRSPVVLCYHGVAPELPADDPHGLVVREADFAAQLDQLVDLGYRLVSAVELWRAVEARGVAGAGGLAAITFDDGMAETLRIGARHLEERGGSGTAFVVPGLLGAPHPDLPELRLADAGELRALAGGPLEFGSHSANHADLTTLDAGETVQDLTSSRDAVRELLDVEVHGLAYPYGRATETTRRAAEAAGYEYACGCSGTAPWHRFAVPREAVFPSTSAPRLRAKAAGLYGPANTFAEWRSSRVS